MNLSEVLSGVGPECLGHLAMGLGGGGLGLFYGGLARNNSDAGERPTNLLRAAGVGLIVLGFVTGFYPLSSLGVGWIAGNEIAVVVNR